MSHLQLLISKLIETIIDYHQHQTKKKTSQIELLKQDPQTLSKSLELLISDATKTYDTRCNYFKYIHYVITKLKPLTDKETPLEDNEITTLIEELVSFIDNTQLLLSKGQSISIPVLYGDNTEAKPMYGFINGWVGSGTVCFTGQIMQNTLLNTFGIPQGIKLEKLREFIAEIVNLHQSTLSSRAAVSEELAHLKLEKEEFLVKNNDLLKKQEDSEEIIASLSQEKASLSKEKEELSQTTSDLKRQLEELQAHHNKLSLELKNKTQKLEEAQQENSDLRHKPPFVSTSTLEACRRIQQREPSGYSPSLFAALGTSPLNRKEGSSIFNILYPGPSNINE